MRHGTRYAYVKKGCRCEDCIEGNRADNHARRQRRWERAKADPSIIPHGDLGYADYGCRCAVCTRGRTEVRRRQKGAQPAKTWTEAEIARAMEVYATKGAGAAGRAVDASTTTIRRWAKERDVSCYRPPLVHGTRSAYTRRGCRCAECVEGNRRQELEIKARMWAKKDQAPHGTATAYFNWRCRCEPCKAAGSAQNAKTRAKRLARVRQLG